MAQLQGALLTERIIQVSQPIRLLCNRDRFSG
jgi:hypothetical protein